MTAIHDPSLDAYVVSPDEQRRRAKLVRDMRRHPSTARVFAPAAAVQQPEPLAEPEPAPPPPIVEPTPLPFINGQDTVLVPLPSRPAPDKITVSFVIREATRHFGFSERLIKSERRWRDLVNARMIAVWAAKEISGLSYPEIGRRFGDRDHSTIIHAVRKIRKHIADGDDLGLRALRFMDYVKREGEFATSIRAVGKTGGTEAGSLNRADACAINEAGRDDVCRVDPTLVEAP